MKELLIVGAGATGSITASLLHSHPNPPTVTVWDKARGAGGRMSTHRQPNNPGLHVDMGAQYLSRTKVDLAVMSDYDRLKENLYEDLLLNQVLCPFSGKIEGVNKKLTESVIQNYVAPNGFNSIVKYFLTKSKASILFQQQISEVLLEPALALNPDRKRVICTPLNGDIRGFDGLVLTLPIPQLLQIAGNFLKSVSKEDLSKMSAVKYSSRYALGLFYKEDVPVNWSAKYFDNPIIRFACWDTAKRNCTSGGSTLLLHTCVPFGIQELENDKEIVKAMMIQEVEKLIPSLPSPVHSHLLRWRYSQVSQVFPSSPGCLVLSHDPLVVATGDGFCGSNFENCIKGAQVTVQTILEHYAY